MGKISYLFKKIRDTKGTFHAKMGSIKDRNGRDLTEADNIKKRCCIGCRESKLYLQIVKTLFSQSRE